MVIAIICFAYFWAKNGAFPSGIEFFKQILYNLKNNSTHWRSVYVAMAIDFEIFPWKIEVTYMHWYAFFTDFTFMSIAVTHLHPLMRSLNSGQLKPVAGPASNLLCVQ